VIIELKPSTDTIAGLLQATPAEASALGLAATLPSIPSLSIDPSFPPVAIPAATHPSLAAALSPDAELPEWVDDPENSTVIVRGTMDESDSDSLLQTTTMGSGQQVVGVYIDAIVQPCLICPGAAALGTDADVARLLCVPRLQAKKMDGSHVLLAIVDTGINRAHLVAHGRAPNIDVARSWAPPSAPGVGGMWPVNHGTMCAFDATIAAPKATILDIALLQSRRPGGSVMEGLLSDGVLAYRHLLNIMSAPRRPGEVRTMVVSDSWGMFQPSWDFPVTDPRNYSDNPNHPFNRIVATLERAGADILFAAGNCGPDCPDGRCGGFTGNTIYGANSSPAVLAVAGVDITGLRVGYSSKGPGHLPPRKKPDIAGFAHFTGSGVYPADGGTSAACPVVAGVVAAVRSKRPFRPGLASTSPAAIRQLFQTTALDRGAPGWDIEYGYGIVNSCRLSSVVTADEGSLESLLSDLVGADGREDGLVPGAVPAVAEPVTVADAPAYVAAPAGEAISAGAAPTTGAVVV
jgi:subtilisin family serine protease